MSIFSRLFRKKNKKPTFDQIEQDLNRDGASVPFDASHAAVDHCEKLIELTRELEDDRGEYRIVTDYLSDVELLQNLPEKEKAVLKDTAENIATLNRNRDSFLQKEKKISDKVYNRMEREQRTMPNTIERFAENERYLAVLERDMGYLENEKVQWEMYGEDYRDAVTGMKRLLKVLLSTAIALTVIVIVCETSFKLHLMGLYIVLLVLMAVGSALVYLRSMNEEREIAQCDANLNRAIKLLNKVRIKYVYVKNAVDYTAKKYRVRSSKELLKQWEAYQEAAREKAKFQTNSEDLAFYTAKLTKLLREYRLYDTAVWLDRPEGFTDPREMVEIKHNLVERRQKLRSRIEYEIEKIKTERAEVERLLTSDPAGREEIEGVLASIDKVLRNESH